MNQDSEGKRQSIPQRIRFEVFKRDKFTCQYCGQKAPEVVLQVDHIHPVAEGGASDILNLITACKSCNGGKGARLLDDMSVIERQRRQIEELEERRQQLEMILQWRDELERFKADTIQVVCDAIGTRAHLVPNDNGKAHLKRWLRQYGLESTLAAVDEAFDQYYRPDDDKAWGLAFNMIGRFLSIMEQEKTDPLIRPILYIQGMLRKRLKARRLNCVDYLRSVIAEGLTADSLMHVARNASTWEEFDEACNSLLTSKADTEC